MNKFIFFVSFLFFFSCSSIENTKKISELEKKDLQVKIMKIQDEIVDMAKLNNKIKIKEKIVSTIKNNLIMQYLDRYDFSNFIILFSDIEIISNIEAKSVLMINYEFETLYFDVIWKYENNEWKISNVETI